MTARKTAWREVLRLLIEDLKHRFVSDDEFVERIWEAWSEWLSVYDRLVSEAHYYELTERWKTRPNLNSTPAELEWLAEFANTRTARFWKSALLRKAIAAFRAQRAQMEWDEIWDQNLIAYYLGR